MNDPYHNHTLALAAVEAFKCLYFGYGVMVGIEDYIE